MSSVSRNINTNKRCVFRGKLQVLDSLECQHLWTDILSLIQAKKNSLNQRIMCFGLFGKFEILHLKEKIGQEPELDNGRSCAVVNLKQRPRVKRHLYKQSQRVGKI